MKRISCWLHAWAQRRLLVTIPCRSPVGPDTSNAGFLRSAIATEPTLAADLSHESLAHPTRCGRNVACGKVLNLGGHKV